MGTTFSGSLDGRGLRFAIVVSRYNETITRRLLEAARETLHENGVSEEGIDVAWVPGAFEIPLVAKQLAVTGRYDAIICLGCVIKGETAHFEHVSREAAHGIARVSYETGVPTIFQVLTAFDLTQAMARTQGALNRGREAALAAIEMARLMERLRRNRES
ncbi:MAG: 6,7-dimethyl-8-ribityllumazine synthase [Armatimonadota bacterium]|nr:6,7-dimethyl-8-ribityllumazine synthase [Armatimonadota bacterium]MDR5703205.1 6,7-dimethyl-8-ribityllumazine synthase [Armatimonadota bacterium]MDR7435516.1 6,7-dimethyl-8-ribityllumazine synthase [Armatimonadota bacterium]